MTDGDVPNEAANAQPTRELPPDAFFEALDAALRKREAGRFDAAEFVVSHPEHGPAVLAQLDVLDQLEQPGGAPVAMPRMDTSPPAARLGQFELHERIGQGGMGIVHAATQVGLDRTVAVKILPAGFASTPELRQRFEREASLAARLTHPAIVRIYAFGEEAGTLYLAMERIDGASLEQALGRLEERTLESLSTAVGAPPADSRTGGVRGYIDAIVSIGIDVADALAAAHAEALIHRDVKPGNILLDRSLRPHLADFGLAREHESANLTRSGRIIGTPSYLAPECVEGKKATPRTDVFALGATLYEALVGRMAFRGETTAEALHRILHFDPPAIDRVDPRLPRDLATVVQKAIEKDPAQRYRDAAALRDDLGRFQRGEPVSATRVGVIGRFLRRARRRRGLTAAFAILALVVLAVVIGAAVFVRSDRAQQERRIGRLLDRARVLESGGDLAAAKEVFDAIRKLDPHHTASRTALERIDAALAAERNVYVYHQLRCDLYVPGVRPSRSDERLAAWVDGLREDREGLLLRAIFAGYRRAFDPALALLDRVAQHDDGAAVHLLRARYLVASGRTEDAAREREAGERMAPRHLEDYCFKSARALDAGRIEVARDLLLRAEQRWPDAPPIQHLLGALEDRLGHFTTALRHYDRALSLNPEFGHASIRRGFLRLHLLRPDEAKDDFERALELNPANREARIGLARVLHRDPATRSEAIAILDALAEAAPDDGTSHWARGDLAYSIGNYRKAVIALGRAIRCQEARAVGGYVRSLVKLGKRKEASDYVDRSIARGAKWDRIVDLYNLRGWLDWKDPEKAAAAFRKGLEFGRNALLVRNLGVLNAQNRNYAVAERLFSELVDRGYEIGPSLVRRAMCRANMLDAERAVRDHERGLERIRENPLRKVAPWMIVNYAYALAATGRIAEAADQDVHLMNRIRWRAAAEGWGALGRFRDELAGKHAKRWEAQLVRYWRAVAEGRFEDARPQITIARSWPRLDIGTAIFLAGHPRTPAPLLEMARKIVRGEATLEDVPRIQRETANPFTLAVVEEVRAEMLLRAGKVKASIEIFERVVDRLPHPMVAVRYAIALALDGRGEDAVGMLKLAHEERKFPLPFIVELLHRAGVRPGLPAVDAWLGGDPRGL